MATDLRFYYGGEHRVAFHEFVNSANATGNGVEVVAAVAGASIHVSGFSIGNDTAGPLIFTVVNNAGAADHDHISPDIHVATVSTHVHRYHEPLACGRDRNMGFVASGAGNVGFEVWGYYAEPTQNPEEQSQSMSRSASASISMSRSKSQSQSQSRSQSASQLESASAFRSQSRSASRSMFMSASKSKSQSMSIASHVPSKSRSKSMSKSASLAESLSAFKSQSRSRSVSIAGLA